MLEIKKLAFDHIHKAAKGQFHKEVLDMLYRFEVDKLLPQSLVTEYERNVQHYAELNSQYAADPLTTQMERVDRARDVAYNVIHTSLGAMEESLDDEVAAYYVMHIKPLFGAFWDFSPKADYASETTLLRSFCSKLKKMDFSILNRAYVTEQQVDDLDALNRRFETIYVERNDRRAGFESPSELAKTMEEQWKLIAAAMVAKANEPLTDENRAAVEAAQNFVGAANEHIDYYRKYNIARGKKK